MVRVKWRTQIGVMLAKAEESNPLSRKTPVMRSVPQEEAIDKLLELIENDKR